MSSPSNNRATVQRFDGLTPGAPREMLAQFRRQSKRPAMETSPPPAVYLRRALTPSIRKRL
jgi:hypothetical protein